MVTDSTETSADFPVRRIFNHDVMSCTADGVPGNHLYSGRVLGATLPGDVIQLHPDLRSQWGWICDHYRRIGLRHTDEVVWDVHPSRLDDFQEHDVSWYFFGPAEQEARPDTNWLRAVAAINCKNGFMELAERLAVPVPLTKRFDAAADIGAADLAAVPYPCYLKAAVSVSGVGIYRCADAEALSDAIRRFPPTTPVQIQQEVAAEVFLNLQYEVTSTGLHRLAATEQLLDGCAHQGNRFPARHAPWEAVEPMAQWLHVGGMRGVFAFDVAVVERDGRVEHLAIECNPRFNGASYPTAVANKLAIPQWLARSFGTRHRSLADLDLTGIEYDPGSGEGVILINWGPILVGKMLLLLAGDETGQARLVAALNERL